LWETKRVFLQSIMYEKQENPYYDCLFRLLSKALRVLHFIIYFYLPDLQHGVSRLSSCTSSCVKMYTSNKAPEDLQTFHRQADETLEQVTEALENYVDEHEVEGSDIEHTQGVLTIKLGTLGSYVINKQTPNKQIWLSSPVSGPFRYDLKEGAWVYERAGEARRELISQLETEISDLVGVELKISN